MLERPVGTGSHFPIDWSRAGYQREQLWTPSGEHQPEPEPDPRGRQLRPGRGTDVGSAGVRRRRGHARGEAGRARRSSEALRRSCAETPVAAIVANHAVGLRELGGAAPRASTADTAPRLDEAALAIDAMAALVEGLGDRLGPNDAAAARRARRSSGSRSSR